MVFIETILGASLQVLFDKLASPELFKFVKRPGIHTCLVKWNNMLCVIREVLADAERKESGNVAVKLWLDDLRAFTYDAEDLLDEIATDASTTNHQKFKNHVLHFVDSSFKGLNPTAAFSNLSIESKIDDMTKKLQNIMDQKNSLHLSVHVETRTISISTSRESTCLFDKSSICGREDEKKEILRRLFSSNVADTVIPIVGMAGMGKTTLAQLVFDDDKVKRSFNLRVWAYVSQDFDILGLTKNILQSVISNNCGSKDLNWLQTKLNKTLSKKKFLIVLDDVWNELYDDWDRFYLPFRTGVSGCKIVVTTRNAGVASNMGVGQPYHLQQLSTDHCLSLFAHHALGASNFNAHPNLQSIGRKMVKKCSGCPLVAKALGGLLRTKRNPNEWEALLHAEVWDSLKKTSSAIPGLMLSYQLLPSHLKRCFAYCSLFPKSYLFDKDELVRLWIAEGFLQQEDEQRMEDVGGIYFFDLVSRSFFQPSSRYKMLFEMHDLISDLCQVIADDVFLHLENKLKRSGRYSFPQNVRHASFLRDTSDVLDRIQPFNQMKCFRTLLALASPDTLHRKVCLSNDLLLELLSKVSRLRVLSLNYYKISELPDLVCFLRHLRYLNLSGTPIKYLPKSVSSLINLQALLLSKCHILVKLPQDIENLVNLRELDIADTPKLQEMPAGIGMLGSLRKLCKFIVGEDKGLGIKELGNLSQLQGDLFISGLHNVVDEEDAKKANLKDKDCLDDLSMEWSSKYDGSNNNVPERQVLNSLEPHVNLKKLMIKCYGGPEFAPWIGHPSFKDMVSVKLYDCRTVQTLPSLGRLLLLRELSIRGMHGVRTVGSEFYGDGYGYHFPCLETLRFEDMPKWKEWLFPNGGVGAGAGGAHRMGEVERDFPCLLELQLVNCPELIGKLPKGIMNSSKNNFSPLVRFEIKGCPSLAYFPAGETSTPSLKQLIISDCSQLECITQRMPHFSTLLERIDFSGYTNLKSLPVSLHSLVHLVKFSITNCPSLESFPNFPQSGSSFPNLKELSIYNCDSLRSLPNHMQNITSLQSLHISSCQGLVSFPEGGFPPNLTCLSIWNCVNIDQPMSEWGLCKLTSLLRLTLHAVCRSMVSFPDQDILPSSITYLCLSGIENLESLSDEILELTSLEDLSIEHCPMFQSMEGLPLRLNRFSIRGCPIMKQRCQMTYGDYWDNISHIRWVERD